MLQILLAVAMRGPMGRIDGVQSLPDLKDRSEPPLPILEPVPTFSVGPKPQTQQTQVLSTPVSSRVGTANGRVGTANGRRPVSSKKNLPSLGVWRAHFADKDLPKEVQIGDRWWISSEIQRTGVHGKKLPSLASQSDAGDASLSKGSFSRASSPRTNHDRTPGAWHAPSKGASEIRTASRGIERQKSERSFSRTHSMATQSVASLDEMDDEKTHYEFGKSEMHCRRTITMTERKRNHNAALARDKVYVQKLLKEGREKNEDRLAREQALDGHWFQAAFSPVSDPSKYLAPALSGMLPLTRQQVKQATDATAIARRSSAVSHEVVHEIVLEHSDIQEAYRVCNLFCALTTPEGIIGNVDAPVMSRQTFCHLACAAQGFASVDGSHPRLCRAARHFDSLAEEVLVKGSATTTSGIVLLDCRSPGVENTPMARLFSKIVQDIVPDFDRGLDFDVVAQRGRAEFQARDRVFFRLLPQAGKYAASRLAHINQQASHIKQWLEKREAKPKDIKEQELKELKEAKERAKELHLQDRSRLLPVARTPKYPRSRAHTPSTPNKDPRVCTPRTDVEEPKEEGKDFWMQELQVKSENLGSSLFEPEVLRFMSQTSQLFRVIFKAYADIPLATGQGHMSLSALFRFAADFGLFPHKVDFKTIQWLYNAESQAPQAAEPRTNSVIMAPRKTRKKTMVNSEEGLLYHHKWLKPHLAWMSKEPASMTEAETRSCLILTAIDDWLESHNLKVKEMFANTDTANTSTFTLQDLQLVVDFMDFEDPPTSGDLQALIGLLVFRQGSTAIDFPTLEMARVAARLAKESRSRARNCFLKDLAKMSKLESSAYLFFTELAARLELSGLAPGSFYRMLDVDHTGLVSVGVVVRQARSLQQAEPGLSSSRTAAMAIDNPFTFIGKTVDDDVTEEEFVDLLEEIREASRLREASFEQKHPLFISSGTVQPANSKESPFGAEAFVKVVMKIGLMYLTYYGNEPQAQLSSFHKLLWLFIYMHWYFDSSRQKAEELLRQSGLERPRSKRPSRGSSGDLGRRYPKHLPAMRQLLVRHPTIFMEVEQVELPGWASPQRTADAILAAAFRDVPKQGGSPEDGWRVEGVEGMDEDDAGASLGPIEEDPQPVIQGPTTLERTLLVTAFHAHDLAESMSEADLGQG